MSGSESNRSGNRPANRQDLEKMLELRRKIKARTPYFRRFESWRFVRLDEPWRKPKGVDNHQRLSVKGWPHLVKVGYRVPKEVRYLHPSGYRDVLIHNMRELEALSADNDAARIASGVGRRKRIELATRARDLGIRVLNGRRLLSTSKENEEVNEEDEKKKDDSKKDRKKK
jgi:large subunit ribosomal protein L32e